MKFTGTYNGKPIELELTEEQIEVLKQVEKKKTGWEKVKERESYWVYDAYDKILEFHETSDYQDDRLFSHANYFSDNSLAQNIIRAQELQRKLWRRSAELCEKVDWSDGKINKCGILYDCHSRRLWVSVSQKFYGFGHVYFDTKEHAEKVMNEFHDELIWYFTKFESRMD